MSDRSRATVGQQDRSGRLHVLNEELFRGLLIRERRRADRSNQPLALILVRLEGQASRMGPHKRAAIVASLSAAKRDTDVVGWFEQETTIGCLLLEIPESSIEFLREFEARLWRELWARLDRPTIDHLSIQVHVHQEAPKTGVEKLRPVDPLLEQVRRNVASTSPYDGVKRGLDITGSLSLLVICSPLLLLIAALVKMKSPGPVFFRQVRVGQMMKPFTLLKFRTMHVGATHTIHHEFVSSFIKSGVQAQEAGRTGLYKIANDPRVTPIGRILRKTSLDELPQLWNVLCGEMSLVGPRPPLHYEVEQYQPWHRRRVLEAKPGITGLWQVAGRSRSTFDEMVRLDLRYARACSLWTDLKILLATPAAVIAGKGAC
jgi:lipopolysaccharide/colanic/teichoic acid biosynthesis glycosyltransferase